MAKPVRPIAVTLGFMILCCGLPALGGGLYVLFAPPPADEYSHAYPAPGPGCGDRADPESGVKADIWVNQDYAGVHCAADHVDIDAGGGPDPRGRHIIGANLFQIDSDLRGPSTSDLTRHGRTGFLVTLTVHVRAGGPDARAGITIGPDEPIRAAVNTARYPIYFFNVDLAGQWHAATHDIFGPFLSNLDNGATAPGQDQSAMDHVLRLGFDAQTGTLTFTVDGTVATTVHPPRFETYRTGVGLACSYDPGHQENCQASARDYRYEVTHQD